MVDQLTRDELQAILVDKGADADGDKEELVARLAQLDADGSIVRDWLSRHDDEVTRDRRIFEAQTYALLKRQREELKNRKSSKLSDDEGEEEEEPQPDESELAKVPTMIEMREILGLPNYRLSPGRDALQAQLAELDADGSMVRDWLAKHDDECTRQCRIFEAQRHADWKRECRRLDRKAARKKEKKKGPVQMSADKLAQLEALFAMTRYPTLKELADIEAKLHIKENLVDRWFAGRRVRYAREMKKMRLKKINEDWDMLMAESSSVKTMEEQVSMDVDPQPSTSSGVSRLGNGSVPKRKKVQFRES